MPPAGKLVGMNLRSMDPMWIINSGMACLVLIYWTLGPIALWATALTALGLAALWFFLEGLFGIGVNGPETGEDQPPGLN